MMLKMALMIAVLIACAVYLSGCAVGRNELNGDIVAGIGLGRLTENTNQLAAGAVSDLSSVLPPPFGQLVTLGGSLLLGHMAGSRKGWDEREKAAGTQQPLPTPAPSPVAPVPTGVKA